MATTDYTLERGGLPASVEAERSILGAILLDNFAYIQAAEVSLKPDDFSLDSHRRIFGRITDLAEGGRPVDLITLSEELMRHKELEAIGGAAYISSLTDGLPHRPNIEHWVRMVKDKSLLRGLIQISNSAIARAIEEAESAPDILSSTEADLYELSGERFGVGFDDVRGIFKKSFGSIDEFCNRSQTITGLRTYFQDFDEMTNGLQPSDLIILAARPSMGKTSLAMNMAENAALRDGKTIGIFSLEMSKESLLQRLVCSHARVDSHKFRTGFLSRDDRQKLMHAAGELAEAKIYIDDTPGINLTEMRAKARRLQHQYGLDLLIVDYLQLMGATASGGKRYENRTQEVSAISRGLKLLAKELKLPLLALSQLSRAPESRGGDHRPQLSDLRESGSIEQDADVVMFIFREEVYKPDVPELDGVAELIISKQRNGPTGKVDLAFIKKSTRFESRAVEG